MNTSAKPAVQARPQRTGKRGDSTRRAILDAARPEFATKGFSGASMRGIARSLGTELANIQHHFRDKLSLWNAVLADVFGAQAAEIGRIHDRYKGEAPDVVIRAMITSIMHTNANDPHFVALMSQARFDPLSQEARGYQVELGGSIAQITVLIEQAQKLGRFVPGRPSLLFYQLLGAVLRIFTAAADAEAIIGKPPTSPEVLEEYLESCLAIFMPHMRGQTELPVLPVQRVDPTPMVRTASLKTAHRPTLVYLVGQVEALLTKRLSAALREFDLTTAQMIALVRIARGNKPSAARLARLLDVTPQSVMIMVRGLEAQGLIHRQETQTGRRSLLLDITDHGQSILARLGEVIELIEHETFDGLADEDRDHLRDALVAVLKEKRPLALSEWTPLVDATRQ